MTKVMTGFSDRRLDQELKKLSSDELKLSIGVGLDELLVLITKKPKGYSDEIDLIERTLSTIKEELVRRGELI